MVGYMGRPATDIWAVQVCRSKRVGGCGVEGCQHYWIIPNTTAGKCRGICRKCHARKDFLNQMPDDLDPGSQARKTLRVESGGHYIAGSVAE